MISLGFDLAPHVARAFVGALLDVYTSTEPFARLAIVVTENGAHMRRKAAVADEHRRAGREGLAAAIESRTTDDLLVVAMGPADGAAPALPRLLDLNGAVLTKLAAELGADPRDGRDVIVVMREAAERVRAKG